MAGSRSLGTLTLDLVAKIGGFVRGMDQAERGARKSLGAIEKRAQAFGKAIGVSLGLSIAGLATGAVAALKGAIDRMDELRDASIRLGVGVETLSAFSYAAQQTGTDIDSLGKAFKILAKNMADAGKEGSAKDSIFDAIGVSIKDAQGNLRQLEDIVPDIANAFTQLQDGTQKAALAQELFGKSGLELTEFLNQGSDGLKEMTERARELGLVFDQEAADKADQFNDALADLKGGVSGLATEIAIPLLPVLIDMVNTTKDWITEGDKATTISEELSGAFHALGESASFVWNAFDTAAMTLKGVAYDLAAFYKVVEAGQRLKVFDVEGAHQAIEDAKEFRKVAGDASHQIEKDWSDFNNKFGPAAKQAAAGSFGPAFSVPGLDAPKSFSAVPFSAVDRNTSTIDRNALNRALAGDTGSGTKKHKAGKSEAEKEAERLKKAINEMTDAQRRWQTELDGTGNKVADDYAQRLAEITEKSEDFIDKGIPADKVAQFREEMTKLADSLKTKETAEFLKEFGYQTQEMIANANGASTATIEYAKSIDELDKALKSGIISQAEYNKRAEALADVRDASALQVLRDIREQQDVLGQSAEYQDTYNKLKYAGVDANSAFGQSIIEANHALHEQAKVTADQIDTMDALRDSSRNFLEEWKDSGDIWTSAKDAVDSFFDALFRIITNRMIEKALGENGTTGGGGFGDWIGKAASLFFSSGSSAGGGGGGGGFLNGSFAIGGAAAAGGLYRVNENAFRDGPELLSMGGRDYLMMGAQSGQVTPPKNSPTRTRGGDTFNFNIHAPNETATRDQALGLMDSAQRRQRVRNGKR